MGASRGTEFRVFQATLLSPVDGGVAVLGRTERIGPYVQNRSSRTSRIPWIGSAR